MKAKHLYLILLGIVSLMVVWSCKEEEEPYIKSADNGATITADGNAWSGWSTILQSNIDLSNLRTSCSASWCTANLSAMGNDYQLQVFAEDNPSQSERKAIISVQSSDGMAAVSFNVIQQPGQPVIKFSSSTEGKDQSVAAPAKEIVWTLLSNIPYSSLKVTSNESWCKVKIDNSKDNTDIKSYQLTTNIDENMSDKQRQAVVTISSEFYNVSTSFMVTQSASTFSISHTQLGLDRDGGNRTVTITSNTSWKAECDADWITLEQTNGYLTVRVKPTTINRSANITFKDRSTTTITVNQAKYKVGEEYNEGGVTGTVAYIGDDKRYIFKNTERNEYWCYGAPSLTGYSWSMYDGEHNMQIVKDIPAWYSSFYAFVAVDDLNTGGVTGWYLPAIEELNNMRAFVSGTAWSSTHSTTSVYAAYVLDNGVVSTATIRANIQRGVYAIRKF